MLANVPEILQQLAPYSILVGSASRGDIYNDIDLLVNEKGLALAKRIFPAGWESAFIGNIKTFFTDPPIEVFTYWYDPDYRTIARRKTELITRTIEGVEFRAWPWKKDSK